MRKIVGIIVHCSATSWNWRSGQSMAQKVAEIRRWHKNRGWRDIGYHFLIDRDGTVAEGRPITQDGAHVAGHNRGTIGVCLLGGDKSNEKDKFLKNFTAAQDKALRKLLKDLQKQYGNVPITGHNQYAAKACPGFQVKEWLSEAPVQAPKAPSTPTPKKEEKAAPEPSPASPWAFLTQLFALLGKWGKKK